MTEEEKVQLQSALNKPYVRQLIREAREQVQEDIICYVEAAGGYKENANALCQIVVDNFKRLEDK
jgi:hypothetical protein